MSGSTLVYDNSSLHTNALLNCYHSRTKGGRNFLFGLKIRYYYLTYEDPSHTIQISSINMQGFLGPQIRSASVLKNVK